MALRRKMHYSVNFIFRKNLPDGFLITDIRLHKRIVITFLHFPQIFQIPRIRQGIHIDYADLVTILFHHIVNIIGTNKPCSPRYQISPHIPFSCSFI